MWLPARLAAPTSDPVTAANGKYVSASGSADTADVFTSGGGGGWQGETHYAVIKALQRRRGLSSQHSPSSKAFLQTDVRRV